MYKLVYYIFKLYVNNIFIFLEIEDVQQLEFKDVNFWFRIEKVMLFF